MSEDVAALCDQLEQLRAAATDGPWEHYDPNDGMCWEDPADAALIVALVNAAPTLIAAAREADRLRAAVEGACRAHEEGRLGSAQAIAHLRAVIGGQS